MERIKKTAGKITLWKPPVYVPYAVYIVFLLLFFTVSCFHEPWLDEAQAWLIARDASYHDIIFTLPHYEGHPPLWWLILSIPAKLNMPYEMSLTIVSMVISAVSVYLIIFKSPFCAAFRLTLPFTFFIFYQYGVIARPYCILVLSFMLLAIFEKNKNSCPFKYIFSLVLMCLSSGFGMVIAASLTLAWCINICCSFKSFNDFIKFFKTREFFALITLAVCAVAIALLIIPADDIFTWTSENYKIELLQYPDFIKKGRIIGIFYMLFLIPADSMISSGVGINSSLINYCYNISFLDIIFLLLPSIVILICVLDLVYRKGKIKQFIIPYIALALFSNFVYFSKHHLGIVALFFIYIFWIGEDCDDIKPSLIKIFIRPNMIINGDLVKNSVWVCFLFVNINWLGYCCVNEIIYNYDYGREVSQYLIEHDFEDKEIITEWQTKEIDNHEYTNTNAIYLPVSIMPYFNENIFVNFNCGQKDKTYVWHKVSNSEADYNRWSQHVPEILIGQVGIKKIYEDEIRISDYRIAAEFSYRRMWKLTDSKNYLLIYVKKDLT